MGGNAFNHVRRIRREEITPTLEYIVEQLNYPNLTLDYVSANMMGSTGKQADSGDIDIALNNEPARFVGEPEYPVFDIRAVAERVREVVGDSNIRTKTLRGGQFQSAWPITGNPDLGYVQVDFITGNLEWLKFTHWSPGADVSPWKGVFISTMFIVLAKRKVEYRKFADDNPESERLAEVGWFYDLERGLHRKWRMRKRPGHGLSEVDPDVLETHFADCPRFPRHGYIRNPEEVLNILFGEPVSPSEVETFEAIVQLVRRKWPEEFEELKNRSVEALLRSGARTSYTREEMEKAFE